MSSILQRNYSLEEYWLVEDTSPERHEYWRGDILARAGGSPRQDEVLVEHWHRSGDRFELSVLRGADAVVRLRGCPVEFPVGELYAGP